MSPSELDNAVKNLIAAIAVSAVVSGALLLAAALTGCGGPPREARHALAVSAIAVDAIDRSVATEYTAAHARALSAADQLLDYQRAMAPWNDLETALRVAATSIQAVDLALDSWDAGGQERWLSLLLCAGASLERVARAIQIVGLEAPPELSTALELVRQYGAVLCVQREIAP